MEEAVYTAPFHVWKEAFEKELREKLKEIDRSEWYIRKIIEEILGE